MLWERGGRMMIEFATALCIVGYIYLVVKSDPSLEKTDSESYDRKLLDLKQKVVYRR